MTSFPTWPDLATDRRTSPRRCIASTRSRSPRAPASSTARYAVARGKSRWGDKTPVYGQFVPELLGVLPEAHFVHIIRDGRDVALSLRATWFSPAEDVAGLARHWADQIRTTRQQAAGRDCYTEVRYEDLLAEPADTLRRICAAIDLDYDPAMLAYHREAADRLSEMQDRVLPDGVGVISRQRRLRQPPPAPRRRRTRPAPDGGAPRCPRRAGRLRGRGGRPARRPGLRDARAPGPMLAPVPVRRVLITNCWLRARAGTELYVRDLSLALLHRGYEPSVFSPLLGEVADEIRAAGVVVTDDLTTLTDEPDVLHCHHQHESIAALSRFPDRPGLFVQHGAEAWQDETPVHPRLLRYVAVDQPCLDRILAAGVPDRAHHDHRQRRRHRTVPCPGTRCRRGRAERSSSATTPASRTTCRRCVRPARGWASRWTSWARPRAVRRRDPRSCCPATTWCSPRRGRPSRRSRWAVPWSSPTRTAWPGWRRTRTSPEWRRWNLGQTLLTAPHDVDAICAEIDRYDPDDAARCRDFVRAHWSLDVMVDALVAEYDAVHAGWDPADADHRAELAALAAPLSRLGPLRAELEHARPYVEQTPRLVEAWQHEQEQARLLRQHIEAPAGGPGRAAVSQHPADRTARGSSPGRGADHGGGPGARAGDPSRRPGRGCTWPNRSPTWARCSAEHAVAESGVRTFVVPWHQLPDGRTVAAHPVGGNQVSWRPDAPTELRRDARSRRPPDQRPRALRAPPPDHHAARAGPRSAARSTRSQRPAGPVCSRWPDRPGPARPGWSTT